MRTLTALLTALTLFAACTEDPVPCRADMRASADMSTAPDAGSDINDPADMGCADMGPDAFLAPHRCVD